MIHRGGDAQGHGAAEDEEGQAKGAAIAAQVAGQGKALRVEGGDADAAQAQDQHDYPIRRGDAEQRAEDGGHGDAGDQQVAAAHAVGPQAHQRLAQAGQGHDGAEDAGGGVGEAQFEDDQGQDRGQHGGVGVGCEVGQRQEK